MIIDLKAWLFKKRRDMFYLIMDSAHFVYGYMVSYIWQRENVLFNDALNRICLYLYGIRHF